MVNIYVLCIYLKTNSDFCHLQHKLIGFYNPDEKFLQRGTDWVFKYSGLRFVCKGLIFMCCSDRHVAVFPAVAVDADGCLCANAEWALAMRRLDASSSLWVRRRTDRSLASVRTTRHETRHEVTIDQLLYFSKKKKLCIYIYIYIGKVHPRTGHQGPGGSRGIALLIF